MILDYEYSAKDRKFIVSYINQRGTKSFYEFNIQRFKTYYATPTGRYTNWDGSKCDIRYTDKPSKFDLMEFIEDLKPEIKNELFDERSIPKVYTWDIETMYDPAEKPEPETAKYPVTAISIVSPEMKVMVLGTKELTAEQTASITSKLNKYLSDIEFCKEMKLKGEFIYKKFDSEASMLEWFIGNIVAKVPILAGWNSDNFDQQYLVNRIKNYYAYISLSDMSCKGSLQTKKIKNAFNPDLDTRVLTPSHTAMIDMMDIINTHDYTILPIKESLTLNWISQASLGAEKIEYEGDLNQLLANDPETFYFYNAIDSVLVQLIHKKFRTLNLIFNYANTTHLPIGQCYGKIRPAEALFFQNFYNKGLKVVYYPDRHVERGTLVGAYVKQPTPGKYNWACCFDFASLYPTQVMTCNLSVENFILPPDGKWSDEELDKFKSDPNYFVSVNGNVYKNDKDYAFREIQQDLKANRNKTKYLAKELDAQVMSVIDRVIKNKKNNDWAPFSDDVKNWMQTNYGITDKHGVAEYPDLQDLKFKVHTDIDNMVSREQSFKLLGNSCYGGSSHQSFYWYNMDMASDITGESRALIHMMEDKTQWVFDHWGEMTDLHKQLGITIDPAKLDAVKTCTATIYQDTDSSYVNLGPIVDSINELKDATDRQKCEFCVNFAEGFMNDYFLDILDKYFTPRHVKNRHLFELETVSKGGIWLNVKKRYGQALMWKDGRYYDEPKMKVKGLEVIKGSYPKFARNTLKDLLMYLLLEDTTDSQFIHKLNKKLMQYLDAFKKEPIDNITENIKVNNYWKGIESDSDPAGLQTKLGASFNVKALGLYNWYINIYKKHDDHIYGGKVKCYLIKKTSRNSDDTYFAYGAGKCPKWAPPVDYDAMFTKTVIEPINRIISPIGLPTLNIEGSIELDLFSGLF